MISKNINKALNFLKPGTFLFWIISAVISISFTGGCGDFFARKPTELESIDVLKELSQIRENRNINIPIPEIYTRPPVKVNIKNGLKVLYFTRHHPSDSMASLITQQFGYKVTQIPSTNQIVIYCPDDIEADKVLEYLDLIDVPPIQVNIDCLILERFGDITMDWETSIFIENFLGEEVTLGENRGTFDDDGLLTALEPAFPGASLREATRANFGLDFGYWINENVPGHQVRTIVDILESRGYLKILLNPTLETINGKKATVTLEDYAPTEQVKTGQGGSSDVFSITTYQWVADSLTVTPFVYSDGYIGLSADIMVGSRSKPEGVTQKAIITERTISVAENRIKPGQSLVIGGMRKSEKRSVIRGVPFFKDIPIIGLLFSSKDFEEKGTEIIFILTPTISSGGRPHTEVVADIRKKHATPRIEKDITDIILDPLGAGTYTDIVEESATAAESERILAEMEMAEAKQAANAEKIRAQNAKEEAQKMREEIEKLKTEAEQAEAEAEKAKTEANSAKAAADKAQKEMQAALQEKEKTLKAVDEAKKNNPAPEAKQPIPAVPETKAEPVTPPNPQPPAQNTNPPAESKKTEQKDKPEPSPATKPVSKSIPTPQPKNP